MHTNSLVAWHTVRPKLTEKQREILSVYEKGGEYTDKQIEQITGKPINTICNRIGELIKSGWLVEVGSTLNNGRRARICSLAKETLF